MSDGMKTSERMDFSTKPRECDRGVCVCGISGFLKAPFSPRLACGMRHSYCTRTLLFILSVSGFMSARSVPEECPPWPCQARVCLVLPAGEGAQS